MRSRVIVAISSGIFFAVALAFVWRSLESARQAEASLTSLVEPSARLEAELRQERARLVERRRRTELLRAELKDAPVSESSIAAAVVKPPAPTQNEETLLASNPGLRALHLKSFRANFSLRHASMYQALGLTPSQINTVEELATARADDLVTLKAAALAQGLAPSDLGLASLQKQGNDQFYAAIATQVSEAASRQTRELDRMAAAQDIAFQANSLSPSGSQNFTGAQIAQLTQLLANASAAYQSGGPADQDSIDWDSVYHQADAWLSGTLPGPQIQSFKSTVEFFKFLKAREQIRAQAQTDAP